MEHVEYDTRSIAGNVMALSTTLVYGHRGITAWEEEEEEEMRG